MLNPSVRESCRTFLGNQCFEGGEITYIWLVDVVRGFADLRTEEGMSELCGDLIANVCAGGATADQENTLTLRLW